MTRAVSADLKEHIVHLYLSEGWTMRQISETLQVSPGLVSKVIAIHRTYGTVIDLMKQRTGRPCNIDNDAAQYLEELLIVNPNMYLDELQQRLQAVLNLDVSIATISYTLCRLAITHKRISKAAAERDEDLWLLWRLDIAQYEDPEMFVFLDESAIDNHTIARTHGWSAEGVPCVKHGTFLRGTQFSILPTLSLGGILALEIFEGSVMKEQFLSFLQQYVAPQLNPFPGKRSIVVLDNCTIYHDEDICHLIEDECGAKLIYLPPYSPDLNPIEEAFSAINTWLQRNEGGAEQIPWLVQHASLSVTPEMARGWFIDCGYINGIDD